MRFLRYRHEWMPLAIVLLVALAVPDRFPFAQGVPQAKPAAAPPRQKELIAILDFDPVGASKAESIAMSDRLREELLRTGRFTLVDRAQLNKVLEEQALQQTGCTSQDCAVQVGRVLGVRKLVTGRAIKVGENLWQVSGTMVDAETAEIVVADSIRHKGDMFSLLDTAIVGLAMKLGGGASPPPPAAGSAAPAAAAVGAPPPPPLPPRPKGSRPFVIFPSAFGGRYGSLMTDREQEIIGQVTAALAEKPALVRAAKDASPVGVTASDAWTGFFVKEPKKEVIWQKAKDVNADLAFMLYINWDLGVRKTYRVHLLDATTRQEFFSTGSWTPDSSVEKAYQNLLGALRDGVRKLLAEYEAAGK
jgi:hypothetical protein